MTTTQPRQTYQDLAMQLYGNIDAAFPFAALAMLATGHEDGGVLVVDEGIDFAHQLVPGQTIPVIALPDYMNAEIVTKLAGRAVATFPVREYGSGDYDSDEYE